MTETLPAYEVRLLRPEDAPGVARLVEAVYGAGYYPPDLYDPARIERLNQSGELVSVVARTTDGQVVGHYALERPAGSAVAEASDAIVLPAHRHRHLMEQMRLVLRAEGTRLGLTGLVGYAVTNHPYSQLAEDHFGAHPCGLAAGLWPRSFHNMPEPLPQRMSFAIYFKYLRPAAATVHVPTRHDAILRRIQQPFGAAVETRPAAAADGPGEWHIEYEEPVQAGTIRVRRVGADSAALVRRSLAELCSGRGAKAVTLELPLAQPGTAGLVEDAEGAGFYFCGLGPAFADDGDALVLQYLAEDIDLSLVQVENEMARELLAYVGRERERTRHHRATTS